MNYDWLNSHHVGKWPFDGDLYDESPNETHLDGWGGGPVVEYVLGKFDQAVRFTGAAGETCADLLAAGDSRLKLKTFTLAGWILTTSATQRSVMSLAEYFDYSGAWGWVWTILDGHVLFESAAGTGATGWSEFYSNRTVNDGQWHWIVITRNNSTTKIYIDGVIDASHSSYSLAYPTTYPIAVAIGVTVLDDYSYYGERFVGNIQRIEYLDVVLSASDVSRLYAFQMGWL